MRRSFRYVWVMPVHRIDLGPLVRYLRGDRGAKSKSLSGCAADDDSPAYWNRYTVLRRGVIGTVVRGVVGWPTR